MDKFAMIIFGASGDLTKRKLMPALYSLYRDKRLTGDFSILGIGRTIYSDENYRSYILEELQQFVKADEQDTILMSSFVSHLYYLPLDPAKEEGYPLLRQRLVELTNEVDPDNFVVLPCHSAFALRCSSFASEGCRTKYSSFAYYRRETFRLRSRIGT